MSTTSPLTATGQESLGVLLPVVARWFRESFGEPTPPQRLGWPSIASGQNTLIFAPTGSGKTLAAFLACLDHLWRHPAATRGVRVLYVSPLKALNQDISRNLEHPLRGILELSNALGTPLRPLSVAVRSGDTPSADRQRLVRKPPEILITTPESMHLMLTSKARAILRSVTHVIVDEIHAICPDKRGVFLALLLERLEALTEGSFVRVGLSATQRPLDEVARYLGGLREVTGPDGSVRFEPRPVTIIDTGQRKELDLSVMTPLRHGSAPAAGSIWSAIEDRVYELIKSHRSTIVFANNRRVVERLTAHLNERAFAESRARHPDEPPRVVAASEIDEPEDLARSHHGSLSQEERRGTEEALKRGELPAVIATASLELGIDMGAVDLVCQVESPGSVARGLQRVGRAGHIVGQVSKGRLIAKTTGDLIESAALCAKMVKGEVEELRVRTNCLDVLAQQVVACVAVQPWDVPALFNLIRRAYPYRDLTASAFESVLKMISGRFPVGSFRDLRASVSWDRIHNRLAPLPGTARLALVNGGTIPDTGQYPVYLGDDGPRLGELDEEFVHERRVGETFVLGTSSWRIDAIEPLRVVVSRAEGTSAQMPFWRGEKASRSAELGEAVGALCREISGAPDDPKLPKRLMEEYRLEADAARVIVEHVARQTRIAGATPDDRTVLVESFRDQSGELGLAVLTPFGGKLHLALKLILLARLRERFGITAACLHSDSGLLFRLPQVDEPPMDILADLTPEAAEQAIRAELGESALFGLRFRQSASRALLMPRPDPGKRTPLWLQRLRAKDLLQVIRKFPDFPIAVEAYRECLNDDLDLPRLRSFLTDLSDGTIRVVTRQGEHPSPFLSDLLLRFQMQFIYEWDTPRSADTPAPGSFVDDALLDALLDPALGGRWLDPSAVGQIEGRIREFGRPPRTVEEMADALLRFGDLAPSELFGPMLGFLKALQEEGRAQVVEFSGRREPVRWINAEETEFYAAAFGANVSAKLLFTPRGSSGTGSENPWHPERETSDTGSGKDLAATGSKKPPVATGHHQSGVDEPTPGCHGFSEPVPDMPRPKDSNDARSTIVRRYLATHALVGIDDLTARYPIGPADAVELLESWADTGSVVQVHPNGDPAEARWADAANLGAIRRLSLAIHRNESVAVAPEVFADELLSRQFVLPETRKEGLNGVALVLETLQGFAAPAHVWETELLPARVRDYRALWLDETLASGRWTWRARGEAAVAFFPRETALSLGAPADDPLAETETLVLSLLETRGASFATDLSRASGLEPSRLRAALSTLMRRGLVTNDRFDPVRPGAEAIEQRLALAAARRPGAGRSRPSPGRLASNRPEGRWERVEIVQTQNEPEITAWIDALLARYGVLTRETAALDPWSPPWRDLQTALARSELRGDVRRGYFVEGLSGVQYARDETAGALARRAAERSRFAAPVLISTLDPANVYGSGAPFDIDLLQGGTARLPRNATNFLVLSVGRPTLIIEGHGKRLTGLASASDEELRGAIALLPKLARPERRVLKVETYNGTPALASPAVPWLSEAGFVRDHPGMAYYAGW